MDNKFFNSYPYTDFHELNLSWVINMLQSFSTTLNQFVSINALKYADPIQWSIVRQYEKNTIVIDPLTGVAYISVTAVPSGVALTNTDYWTVVFDLGAFAARSAQNFTSYYEPETTLVSSFNLSVDDWVVWGDVLYKVIQPISIGEYYVIDTNIQKITMKELYDLYLATIGDLNDLTTSDKSSVVNAINTVNSAISQLNEKINNVKIANVKDYGAKGDGITDDTAAIQAALDNDVVYFPSGVYIISSTLTVHKDQILYGCGDQSIIKLANNANCDMLKSEHFDDYFETDAHDCDFYNFAMHNLSFNGNFREDWETPDVNHTFIVNNTAGNGVCLYGYSMLMDNIYITNTNECGLKTAGASWVHATPANGKESIFNNIRITFAGEDGWDNYGPNDSIIANGTICTSSRKQDYRYTNFLMGVRSGGIMYGMHCSSYYSYYKPSSSLYIRNDAEPWHIENCDFEGAYCPCEVYADNFNFINCRFYASFGTSDVYLNANHVRFVDCYFGGDVGGRDIVATSIPFLDGMNIGANCAYNEIDNAYCDNTPFTNGLAGLHDSRVTVCGYNHQTLIDGSYLAIRFDPDNAYNRSNKFEVNGDFAGQSKWEWRENTNYFNYKYQDNVYSGQWTVLDSGDTVEVSSGFVVIADNRGGVLQISASNMQRGRIVTFINASGYDVTLTANGITLNGSATKILESCSTAIGYMLNDTQMWIGAPMDAAHTITGKVINVTGNLPDLQTTAKDSIVSAINELDDDIGTNTNNISTLNGNVGTLTSLLTTDKSSIVNAINELYGELHP